MPSPAEKVQVVDTAWRGRKGVRTVQDGKRIVPSISKERRLGVRTSIKRSIEHDPGESYTYQGNRISIRERTLTQRSVKKSVEVEDDTDCGETAIKRIGSSCGEMGRITNRSEEKAKRMESP